MIYKKYLKTLIIYYIMSPVCFDFCPASDVKCNYCREVIDRDNTYEHNNCKDYYEFILDIIIEKTKYKLEILLDKKLQLTKGIFD